IATKVSAANKQGASTNGYPALRIKSPAINRARCLRVEAFVRRYAEILRLDFAVTVDLVSAPPNRWRLHSAIGCKGGFCKSCEQLHSTQVCGVSRSRECNSSIRRDLPSPGSPTMSTN